MSLPKQQNPQQFRQARENLEEYLRTITQNRQPLSILLNGLTDPRNIGSLFRIADAARLAHIYFYKMDDAILKNKKLQRVARSTLQYVPSSHLKSLQEIENLKTNHELLALEWTDNSLIYSTFQASFPSILIIGNEQTGVDAELLNLADHALHLPMLGINTSMNVSVATGICVYKLLENRL